MDLKTSQALFDAAGFWSVEVDGKWYAFPADEYDSTGDRHGGHKDQQELIQTMAELIAGKTQHAGNLSVSDWERLVLEEKLSFVLECYADTLPAWDTVLGELGLDPSFQYSIHDAIRYTLNYLESERRRWRPLPGGHTNAMVEPLLTTSADDFDESEDICARLVDSEEHAVESAIPPIAEDAVDLIRRLASALAEAKAASANHDGMQKLVRQLASFALWDYSSEDGTPYKECEPPADGFLDSHQTLMRCITEARKLSVK